MTSTETRTGGCLCGAVRVTATFAPADVHACHCDMCRRWGGGPGFAVELTAPPVWEGEGEIALYRSSDWAERAFCRRCGTGLFSRLVETGTTHLNTGVLDDQAGLGLSGQIFIDEKPAYYALANATPVMTGAEVFALFAPKEEGQP